MFKKEKRTYADRAEYIKATVAKQHKEVRLMAIEYRVGGYQLCGYKKCNRALGFHHNDLTKKDFGLAAHGLQEPGVKLKANWTSAY